MSEFYRKSPTPSSLQYRPGLRTTPITPVAQFGGVAVDPITVMIKECMSISSAMRKMTRWSQSGVAAILGTGDIFGDDDPINGLASNLSSGNRTTNGNPLLSSFFQLRTILTEAENLNDIDCLTLTQPFLLLIKSPSTSGYITSLALNAITKFIDYEIISWDSKNLQGTLIQIISSLTHCRFEASDQNSDDAVSLKVIRLLEQIIVSPLSNLLPDAVISEVAQTCLSLACNKKRSEVLRKAAEMAMMSITIRVFSQLKHIEAETNTDLQTNFEDTKLREDIIGSTEADNLEESLDEQTPEETATDNIKEEPELLEDKPIKDEVKFEEPFGILSINELLGILILMISPSNQYQQMESTRVFALVLINTAIEVAGHEIPKHTSLMNLVSDTVSKHVLQIITSTDSPALLQASLQLFSTIAVVLGAHLKSQIELTLTLMLKSILPDSTQSSNDMINDATIHRRSPGLKEMFIECLSLLWTRSPTFFSNLFIDYDCDFDRSDLAVKVIELLCTLALPESAIITTDNVPPICLEGILSFISGVNDRMKITKHNTNNDKVSKVIKDKEYKTAFIRCTEILNEDPKKGIQALKADGFISNLDDTDELATFFFTKSGRLNKKILGEYLAKPSNTELLKKYINLFDFEDLRVDEAIRILLKGFRLPGESQQIERVVELFAERYVSCQDQSTLKTDEEVVRPDRDSVFILSYSIIMLNTDLHNPQVKQQMLLEDYKRNLRGVYNGKDFPEWYLSKIYSSIKDREIIMPEEHHGTDKWFDDVWHNLISSQSYTPDQMVFDLNQTCQFDKVIFGLTIDKIIDTLITVFKEASDDHIITRLMATIDKCANICIFYNSTSAIDKLINLLAELTTLTKSNKRDTSEDESDSIPITQIKIDNKDDAVTVSEMAVWFGRDFKAQLSTVVLFRLIKKTDCKVTPSWKQVIRMILTLFENCLIDPNFFSEFQRKIRLGPLPNVKPRYIVKRSSLNNSGILSTFSSFFKGYSDEPPEPTTQEIESTLSTIDCVKSVNFPKFFDSISRSKDLKLFIELLLESLPQYDVTKKRFYESEVLFLSEIIVCFCLLLDDSSVIIKVFESLPNNELSKKGKLRILTYKLLLSRRHESDITSLINEIANFDKEDLAKFGGQLIQPLFSLVDHDAWCCKLLVNVEEYWKVLRVLASIPSYAKEILDFMTSIIKHSKNEINSNNFMPLLGLLDEISSLGAIGSQIEQDDSNLQEKEFYIEIIDISKKSISLTSDLGKILKEGDFESNDNSHSVIQAIAHQCFNPCREVRSYALNILQKGILKMELDDFLTPSKIFEFGLFPLLSELAKPEVIQTDVEGFSATRGETLSLISKVFLHYCNSFSSSEMEATWLAILDNFNIFYNLNTKDDEKFSEASMELLKNMFLVLESNETLVKDSDLWNLSLEKVSKSYPTFKNEIIGNADETDKEVKSEASTLANNVEEKQEPTKEDEIKEPDSSKAAETI